MNLAGVKNANIITYGSYIDNMGNPKRACLATKFHGEPASRNGAATMWFRSSYTSGKPFGVFRQKTLYADAFGPPVKCGGNQVYYSLMNRAI